MRPRLRIDCLHVDADLRPSLADGAFDDVARAQFLTHFPDVDRLALELSR